MNQNPHWNTSRMPKGQGGCTSVHKLDFLHGDRLCDDNSIFDH